MQYEKQTYDVVLNNLFLNTRNISTVRNGQKPSETVKNRQRRELSQ